MKQREIAVRGFINDKFGKSFGKGLFHRAIYNGSIELRDPGEKYLIDLFTYEQWEAKAKSDAQIEWVKKLCAANVDKSPDALVSWIQHYDPFSKVKTPVDGICLYLPETREMVIHIDDQQHKTSDSWQLSVADCKNPGPKKPVIIASNVDVNAW